MGSSECNRRRWRTTSLEWRQVNIIKRLRHRSQLSYFQMPLYLDGSPVIWRKMKRERLGALADNSTHGVGPFHPTTCCFFWPLFFSVSFQSTSIDLCCHQSLSCAYIDISRLVGTTADFPLFPTSVDWFLVFPLIRLATEMTEKAAAQPESLFLNSCWDATNHLPGIVEHFYVNTISLFLFSLPIRLEEAENKRHCLIANSWFVKNQFPQTRPPFFSGIMGN